MNRLTYLFLILLLPLMAACVDEDEYDDSTGWTGSRFIISIACAFKDSSLICNSSKYSLRCWASCATDM